jgi:glutamyl-tRNA synthetase
MGITCVIRGEDHISNTPKQILMYRALGFNIPKFAHLPLILSPEGGRMSKRFGATSVREYKEAGYLKEALVNYLLLLGWSPGNNREIISLEEAKEIFDIKDVNKTGAVFSLDKLNWINSEYIKKKNLEELTDLIEKYLKKKNSLPPKLDKDYLKKLVSLFKERITTLKDFIDWTKNYFYDDYEYEENTKEILERNLAKEIKVLIENLSKISDFNKEIVEKVFRETASICGLKPRDLVHPTRVALTGKRVGPGLFETMEVLGKNKVLERLERLVRYWEGGV